MLMEVRNDWTLTEVNEILSLPFMDLVFKAQQIHRRFQRPNTVQISTLLSIKTGACPEDCAYCPQSVRFDTGLKASELMEVEDVAARARAARMPAPPASVWVPPIAPPNKGICAKCSP
jgi:biotin synthase